MSNHDEQRTRRDQPAQRASDVDGGGSGLPAARAETDRLFAIAAKSFEAMGQGDSREFLRRSRQTGGQ